MSTRSFVEFLRRVNPEKERAMLAILRRGLRNGEAATDTFQYIAPHLFEKKEEESRNRWMFITAELFAIHPNFYKPPKPEPAEAEKEAPKPPPETIGRLFWRLEQTGKFGDSLTKRFQALLKSHQDEVGEHLRHALKLAKTHDIPIDYEVLLRDLGYWSHQEKFVQLQWAKDFWKRHTPVEIEESTTSEIAG